MYEHSCESCMREGKEREADCEARWYDGEMFHDTVCYVCEHCVVETATRGEPAYILIEWLDNN